MTSSITHNKTVLINSKSNLPTNSNQLARLFKNLTSGQINALLRKLEKSLPKLINTTNDFRKILGCPYLDAPQELFILLHGNTLKNVNSFEDFADLVKNLKQDNILPLLKVLKNEFNQYTTDYPNLFALTLNRIPLAQLKEISIDTTSIQDTSYLCEVLLKLDDYRQTLLLRDIDFSYLIEDKSDFDTIDECLKGIYSKNEIELQKIKWRMNTLIQKIEVDGKYFVQKNVEQLARYHEGQLKKVSSDTRKSVDHQSLDLNMKFDSTPINSLSDLCKTLNQVDSQQQTSLLKSLNLSHFINSRDDFETIRHCLKEIKPFFALEEKILKWNLEKRNNSLIKSLKSTNDFYIQRLSDLNDKYFFYTYQYPQPQMESTRKESLPALPNGQLTTLMFTGPQHDDDFNPLKLLPESLADQTKCPNRKINRS